MQTRDDLLKWAKEHNYPALQFTGTRPVKFYPVRGLPPAILPLRYAIGIEGSRDNKMLWEAGIGLGTNDMINGLLAHIKTLGYEQIETMKKSKVVRMDERRRFGR